MIFAVFLGLFATVALLLILVTGSRSKESKQTLARLDSIASGLQAPSLEEEPLVVRRNEVLSGIKWIDQLLQGVDLAKQMRLLLYQADLDWSPPKLILMTALIFSVCGYMTMMRTGSLMLAVLLGAAAGSLPTIWVFNKRSKRFYHLKERLPEAVDLMVSAIRAGHSFSSAMGLAARECPEPVRREFRQCYEEQNYGLDVRVAMTNLAYRAPIRDIRMIATAVLVQKETGGNLTEILERAAMLIREDFRLQRQLRVHTAQGRMTGWILCLLPPVLGIGLYFVNPEHMSILWRRPIGVRMLEASVVMSLVGSLIIRKIIRIEI